MKCLWKALIITFVMYAIPWSVFGDDSEIQELKNRIESLERQVAIINQTLARLQQTEPNLAANQPAATDGLKWQDKQNWRRLRSNMSKDEVRLLLGEPDRIRKVVFEYWYYGDPTRASVTFSDERLQGWEEPR